MSSASLVSRLKRRAWTVPGLLLVAASYWFVLLPLLAVTLVADVVRGLVAKLPLSRLVLALGFLLAIEVAGLVALFWVWLSSIGSHERRLAWTYAVQRWYVRAHFLSVAFVYRLTFDVEGDAVVRPGPLVVMIRHVSTLDVLLPGYFLANAHGLKLRYVLKRELLVEPCLDIAGHVLPNHFVSRTGEDTQRELDAIAKLKSGLGPDEGVIIYPEGTRFTPERRASIIERAPTAIVRERAESLANLLPCRTGGARALLSAAPAADVLFMAQHGFEGLTRIGDLTSGALVGRRVKIRFWRDPAAEVPADAEAQARWVHEKWQRMDRWLGEQG